jgi:hypothetical protein
VRDALGIAMVGEQPGQSVGDANTLLGHRQKHDAAVGSNAPAVEGGDDFLKREQLEAIVWSWRAGRSLADGVIGVSS